jgi:diaminohydroxyphosphoribosylaminopyrimidine deaminase/5-amino-6-(5-phosphoribosylamino)uracil reductase
LALDAVLELLGRHGVLQAMVEGGASVLGALARDHLADRVVAYVAPLLLGTAGRPAIEWEGPATLADAPRLVLHDVQAIGDDVRIDLRREAA